MKGPKQHTGLLIIVWAIAFSFPVSTEERVTRPDAGFGLDPPAGWHAATLAEVQANRARVRLPDPDLQRALVTRSALPLVAFTKYAEPHPGLNPTVQVTLRAGLSGTPTELLTTALEPLRRGFADFRIVTPVHAVRVAGWPAAHVRTGYTLRNDRGDSFRILSRLWLVPRGQLMFLIGMSGSDAGVDVCTDEFAAVLASITIEP